MSEHPYNTGLFGHYECGNGRARRARPDQKGYALGEAIYWAIPAGALGFVGVTDAGLKAALVPAVVMGSLAAAILGIVGGRVALEILQGGWIKRLGQAVACAAALAAVGGLFVALVHALVCVTGTLIVWTTGGWKGSWVAGLVGAAVGGAVGLSKALIDQWRFRAKQRVDRTAS